MCLGGGGLKTQVVVERPEDRGDFTNHEAAIMTPLGRRNYIFHLPRMRKVLYDWLVSLGGGIPDPVYTVLMHSDWEQFCLSPVGLRIGVFMVVLYFFEVNDAPIDLRREFWCWILPKPIFDSRGEVGPSHPYTGLFVEAVHLDGAGVALCGGFHDVKAVNPLGYHGTVWHAFNIWGCQGICDEDDVDTIVPSDSEDENLGAE